MRLALLSSTVLVSRLLGSAFGFGTTVFIAVDYCPATYTSSSTGFSTTSSPGPATTRTTSTRPSTSSVGPVEPFFLSFSFDLSRRRDVGDRQYVKSDGSITENPQEAVAFTITTDGQLMSGRGYVSTSGQVPSQRFQVQSSLEPISTRFSVEANGTLSWENSLFVNGRAVFCVIEALFVAFDGNLPAGCRRIRLDSIPSREVQSSSSMITVSTVSATQSPKTTTKTTPTYVSLTTTQTTAVSTPTTSYEPGTVFGSFAYGSPRGCFVSSINSPAVLGPYTTVSNLNQCADFCVGFKYFGVQAGTICACGNNILGTQPGVCDVPCPGNQDQICGGLGGAVVYEIVFRSGEQSTSSASTQSVSDSSTSVGSSSSSYTTAVTTTTPPLTSFTLPPASTILNSEQQSSTSGGSLSSPSLTLSSSASTVSGVSSGGLGTSVVGTTQGSSVSASQTSIAATTTVAGGTCSSATPTAALCPNYNRRGINVNGDGVCYEIYCQSTLVGQELVGNATRASSLDDCIGFCTLYNVAIPFGCVGANYKQADLGNNCRLMSLVSSTGVDVNNQAGRLIFAGYPVITDSLPGSTSISTGTVRTSSTTSSSVASSSTSVGQSQVTSSTTLPTTAAATTTLSASQSLSSASATSSSVASTSTTAASSTSGISTTTTTTTTVASTTSTTTTVTTTTTTTTKFTNVINPVAATAYPVGTVCENDLESKFEGGQVLISPQQARYYNIECSVNYEIAPNSPGFTTPATSFLECVGFCDQAAAFLGSDTSCVAASWTASTSRCSLFGSVDNNLGSTSGIIKQAGVHSGRYLYNQYTGLAGPQPGPSLQTFLRDPIPFPVGPTIAPATDPSYPGGTNTFFTGYSANSHATPLDLFGEYGIQWKIFDQISNKLFVTANFWFTTTSLTLDGAGQSQWSVGGRNNEQSPLTFPTSSLPDNTLSPFWIDGITLSAGQQGISYRVDTISTGRYGISIEWYLSHRQDTKQAVHAITTYDTDSPGRWTTYFFNAGDGTNDRGGSQSVGGQGPTGSGRDFTHCHGQADCIVPGSKLVFDTTQTNPANVVTYIADHFDAATYPVGAWTWATRPNEP